MSNVTQAAAGEAALRDAHDAAHVDTRAPARRKKLFALLGAAVAVCATGYGAYWHFIASRYVSTDNAYTAAEVASVTPAVTGIVKTVNIVDTQAVRKGDVLVVIDDTDARLALAQAEAEVGRAERKVRGYIATDKGLTALVAARAADAAQMKAKIVSAQADYDRTAIDLKRREALAQSGSVSGEELSNARASFASAKASLAAAKAALEQAHASRGEAVGSLDANKVLIDDTTVDTNPEVQLARAKRDQARVDLGRTVLRAPFDGVVAQRNVQVGQRVKPGDTLLSVVPMNDVHVDANFKEVQLDKVHVGQPATMTSDMHGSRVEYHGHVTGLAGGSGSAFAMIPAQNATGNWIKVVQRLPVRISIDPDELRAHPLSVGLSMEVEVDTHAEAGNEAH
ncbi:HlyD family secretion protein [Trinickia caryophylli]|uniref:Membrane fusion protein, multidrug efflux system n=1 Tax=Trinickia caryophylli TaxID=28094 RepID=A0A1X7GPG3_TRICW|nr:HlyD family secretion protein [Trinickia caryophylli]PMS10501.1 HlyD family secretion protein [Trinickia caryophylli]TRX19105.1 HlyD family secretion protein [Trinickia caryophylli]WQE13597.1 HlyD family secretion protein [Trinickia caryophylli]SMF72665.1 membrane fusion protein, multidrug efflux system [Trinickia caryophylli]GLU35112.1 hemolysin D [Trinickia caryophylli]